MIIALQTLVFFRESFRAILEQWLPPLFKQLFLTFNSQVVVDDEESEELVFADYDDERGVVFYPPVYAQRYAAVCDCLMDDRWCGQLEKVVNMGTHHDMSFIKYLMEVPGVTKILRVNIGAASINCSSDLLDFTFHNYRRKRDEPLQVSLLAGNASDPDYRLIGCDAVIAIEILEYLLPHDLDRLVHNVFGFIKPWIAIFTTPNADFNILIKSSEKNGYRRMDHCFEWTREQLHDWCSNIVFRYPEYTVSCRGVGPGPPGTSHFGCCSQLVLFISEDYHKQMELNVNSLALVQKLPNPDQIDDFISDWENTSVRNLMLCGPNEEVESITDIRYPKYIFNGTVTPSCSETAMFKSRECQCNLDTEFGKDFVMFNEEEMQEVVRPRNWDDTPVYMIENVANRLNNTMFAVKRFSKATKFLLAKNKIDSLVDTREVIDEISHLTKLLNFNSIDCLTQGEATHIWSNINWGENAPYWNQYYKVMAVYQYPYEVKNEDSILLDLISDEINKFLDTQWDANASVNISKVEIPIDRLMNAIKHITKDIYRVTDLLECNGYEVDGNVVIYSRIVAENGSTSDHEDDWPDNETYSDWETEPNSHSMSDGSNIALDFNARRLRRALDRKVRTLRALLTHDEEITRELNQVVCRLMRIALSYSRGRETPVQSKWLQCKLLDLLTLAEKAILRRKIRFIQRYLLKKLDYETKPSEASEMIELSEIKADDTAKQIFEKYRHLLQVSDNNIGFNEFNDNSDLDDRLTTTTHSNGFIKSDLGDLADSVDDNNASYFEQVGQEDSRELTSQVIETINFLETKLPLGTCNDGDIIDRTQNWVNEDANIPMYSEEMNIRVNSTCDDDRTLSNIDFKHSKTNKICKNLINQKVSMNKYFGSFTLSNYNTLKTKKSKRDVKAEYKSRQSKKVQGSKVIKQKTNHTIIMKKTHNKATELHETENAGFGLFNPLMKPNTDIEESLHLQLTLPKPIPASVIELCHPELCDRKKNQDSIFYVDEAFGIAGIEHSIAATEEGCCRPFTAEEKQDRDSLRRTVGTDAEVDSEMYDQELEISNLSSIINEDTINEKLDITTENAESQTIFLYDINEPSTSKGLQHVGMDVQCGTNANDSNYAMLSATTSLTTVSKMFTTGIKIGDSFSDVRADNTSDFGTSTNDVGKNHGTLSPKIKSAGITIKDSESFIGDSNDAHVVERPTFTSDHNQDCIEMLQSLKGDGFAMEESVTKNNETDSAPVISIDKLVAENLGILNQVSSCVKLELSSPDCIVLDITGGLPIDRITNICVAQQQTILKKSMPRFPIPKYMRPKLSCGGVHVHSYMDQQISQDVVFQGEWQRYRPQTRNFITVKKKNEHLLKHGSKSNLGIKYQGKVISEKTRSSSVQERTSASSKLMKKKEDTQTNRTLTHRAPVSTNPKRRPMLKFINNNTSKVASKVTFINIPHMTKSNQKDTNSVQSVRKTKMSSLVIKKDSEISQIRLKKNYIPTYLKKMPKRAKIELPISAQLSVEQNKTNLMRVRSQPQENISYVVFRNEIENSVSKSRITIGETPVSARNSDKGNTHRRTLSPVSQNSSSCSSPNSVATVRPMLIQTKCLSSKRHSTPNNKTNDSHKSTDNKITARIRKFIKKVVISKPACDEMVASKEHFPRSSYNSKSITKQTEQVISGEGNDASTNNISKPVLMEAREKQTVNMRLVNSNDSKNVPGASEESKDGSNAKDSDKVVILESCKPGSPSKSVSPITSKSPEEFGIIDNKVLSEWMASSNLNIVEGHTSNILAAMKQLVEESLDFIDTADNFPNIDSETVVLRRDGSNIGNHATWDQTPIDLSASKTSNYYEPDVFYSDLHSAATTSIHSEALSMLSAEDIALLSFKSVSKLSDCFADNESYEFNCFSNNNTAVRDIYERKETILPQNPGELAIQAFSGLSMNAEPGTGDQQDYVNLIDSETGSMAYDIARQATSEELFVSGRSGRSSTSYASCLPEDDSVVPNWLFQIISQQQSDDINHSDSSSTFFWCYRHDGYLIMTVKYDDDQPSDRVEGVLSRMEADPPMPISIESFPDLDENSNEVTVSAVVGAGAGDGRGMHSDQSQDSSGRGTSLSSSATSSGAQSEAAIIDPAAFFAQFEILRETANASVEVTTEAIDRSARTSGIDSQAASSPNGDRPSRPITEVILSDVDADISSIDTDVPSDN